MTNITNNSIQLMLNKYRLIGNFKCYKFFKQKVFDRKIKILLKKPKNQHNKANLKL